jgi:CheY-like chemotaxis protein
MAGDEGKKLILVVDDEPDIVSYITTLLQDNGYQTMSAADGVEATAKIKEKKPDLVTLDMSMPEKSGVKVYRELKQNPDLSDIKVLVVTGVTGFGGKSESFEKFLGTRKQVPPPDGFIATPIEQEEMLEKVKELIG